ncbi:MAG: hypothetical protein JKY88_14560 [Pseudomonadales bacterium]|nr:hypothetical protein [Pseudomonadales bacterium]
MTQFKLKPFVPNKAIKSVTGQISSVLNQKTYSLSLSFNVAGNIESLKLPKAVDQPHREDELWNATCFELFLSRDNLPRYHEFNYSPSGHWQSYSFIQYRAGKNECKHLTLIKSHLKKESNTLRINLELAYASHDIVTHNMKIGISCILQDLSGAYHYYSLGHALKADFHNKRFHLLNLIS